jgi:hypothetical protein
MAWTGGGGWSVRLRGLNWIVAMGCSYGVCSGGITAIGRRLLLVVMVFYKVRETCIVF